MQHEAAGYLKNVRTTAAAAAAAAKPASYPPTPPDILGPFFKEGAPNLGPIGELNDLPTIYLAFHVIDTDGNPVKNAGIDVWHADENGDYDNGGFTNRGRLVVNRYGKATLRTIRPGHYPISDDEYRCAHIHFKIEADGYKELVTQLYFPDDEHNGDDRWFDPRRVVTTPYGGYVFVLEKA